MTAKQQLKELYVDICNKLTDYEHDRDPETSEGEWLEEFYLLLVRTQNAIDTLSDE